MPRAVVPYDVFICVSDFVLAGCGDSLPAVLSDILLGPGAAKNILDVPTACDAAAHARAHFDQVFHIHGSLGSLPLEVLSGFHFFSDHPR